MKPSHLQAPRTLRDGEWSSWADPIERPDASTHPAEWLILAIGVVALIALIVGVL